MTTVQELLEQLRKFPADAHCYVHDGETAGVVILSADEKKTIGHITTGDFQPSPGTAEIVY